MSNNKEKPFPENEKDHLLSIAHRFEYVVILILFLSVAILAIMAMARLFYNIYDAVLVSWDPKNYQAIQLLFGMVMTVLIALEFGNSILRHIREHSAIIQAREVILIGMMAVIRKIMIIDISVASPWLLAALGFAALSLAGSYWFMQER